MTCCRNSIYDDNFGNIFFSGGLAICCTLSAIVPIVSSLIAVPLIVPAVVPVALYTTRPMYSGSVRAHVPQEHASEYFQIKNETKILLGEWYILVYTVEKIFNFSWKTLFQL